MCFNSSQYASTRFVGVDHPRSDPLGSLDSRLFWPDRIGSKIEVRIDEGSTIPNWSILAPFWARKFRIVWKSVAKFWKITKNGEIFKKNQLFWAQNVLKTDFVMHKKLATVRNAHDALWRLWEHLRWNWNARISIEDRYMKVRIARRIEKWRIGSLEDWYWGGLSTPTALRFCAFSLLRTLLFHALHFATANENPKLILPMSSSSSFAFEESCGVSWETSDSSVSIKSGITSSISGSIGSTFKPSRMEANKFSSAWSLSLTAAEAISSCCPAPSCRFLNL